MIINDDNCPDTGRASCVEVIPSSQMGGEDPTERSSNLPDVTQLGRTSLADPERDTGGNCTGRAEDIGHDF